MPLYYFTYIFPVYHQCLFPVTSHMLPYHVISLVSSTPHPNMPRGPSTVLSSKSIKHFSTMDQHHPRLRRHYAAQRAIGFFLLIFHPRHEHHLSPNRVPKEMSELCLHYNTYYLHLVTDQKLSGKNLWRIIHRSYFKDWQPCPAAAIHSAYYFQMRKTTSTNACYLPRSAGNPFATTLSEKTFRHSPQTQLFYKRMVLPWCTFL